MNLFDLESNSSNNHFQTENTFNCSIKPQFLYPVRSPFKCSDEVIGPELSIKVEVLNDCFGSGKEKPWKLHKLQSLSVSKAMRLVRGLEDLGFFIENCGNTLIFKECPSGHEKKLCYANFCRKRSCILCAWRRSLITFHQLLTLLHKHKEKYKSDIPLFLTFTVPNCKGFMLRETIKKMSRAFDKLFRRKRVKRSVRGWFRALEITYNEKENTYHPHYHLILIVPETYFKSDRGLYIDRREWLELWRELMQDARINQVDIRRIKKRKDGKEDAGLVAEVAKYATKPCDYIKKISHDEYYANPEVVEQFYRSLKNVRLLGFGGVLKDLRKELKQEDAETADLVKISGEQEKECTCSVCKSDLMEVIYTWRPGLKNYFEKKTFSQEISEYQKKETVNEADFCEEGIFQGEVEIVD